MEGESSVEESIHLQDDAIVVTDGRCREKDACESKRDPKGGFSQ